jgi:hypothetical protein
MVDIITNQPILLMAYMIIAPVSMYLTIRAEEPSCEVATK